MHGGIELTGEWVTFETISGTASSVVWGLAAIAASRLLHAPVRSAMRRRAGRVAGGIVAGALLAWVQAGAHIAAWAAAGYGEWRTEQTLWLASLAAASLAAVRSN